VVASALAGMIVLAGVALGRIFADPLLAGLVAGAALGSVGLSLGCRRLPNWVVAPMSAWLLAAYTILALWIAARHADVDGSLPQVVRESLVNGIPRLLTAMIPVEPTPDTVVVPVVAAWLAGLAGAEVAVRAGRVLLGLLPPVAFYAGVLYVVGPNAATASWITLAFAALAVAALAAGNRPSAEVLSPTPAPVRGRAAAGAAAGLVAVLALVAAIGPWVGSRVAATPVDPRQYVVPPQVDSLDESPLNRISGWQLEPGQRLMEVSATAPASPRATTIRLRLAVLPDYDGVTWRVGATYRNAGRVLPAQPRIPDAAVAEVHQQITIDGLTGRLLPVVPAPTEVAGARVAFDAATGTLIRPEQLTAGVHYAVTSEVQTPDVNLLPTADVPSGDAVARYLALGSRIPDQIQRLADQLSDGNGAPFDRATAIEDFLAEHYRKVSDAPSGHAFPNLEFFLFGRRDQGGQRGTSEQFAASFAVLARLTGLPSRVVVGFTAPAAGGTVTGGDALAWPEVLFDGLGWVPFDPMPKSRNPRPVEEDFTPKPTKPPSPPSEEPAPSGSASSSGPPGLLAARQGGGPPAVVVAGGASGSVLLVLVAAAFAVITMRRSLRRRRLTAGTPDDRITGAWSEFTDALRLAGSPMPAHLAATEAAAYAARPGGKLRRAAPGPPEDLPPLDHLVAGINTVGFAPGSADHGQANRAGEQAIAYADALRGRRSWWRRAWWSVHPGPLRWR
jgi:transglutaminase-like putative cysteine protease